MGIIRRREDLDIQKLEALFKKRGYDAVNPSFYEECNQIFDNDDVNKVVFQCFCGEVFFLPRQVADTIIKKIGSEKVPCRKCGLEELLNHFGFLADFGRMTKYLEIVTIVEKELSQSASPNPSVFLSKINRVAPEIVNAKSPQELFYQLHQFSRKIYNLGDKKLPYVVLIKDVIMRAKTNRQEFMKIFNEPMVNFLKSRNTNMVDIHNEQYKLLREKIKFYNLSSPMDLEKMYGVQEKELEINAELNAYNHLVEEKKVLEVLFNLVKIASRFTFESEPFKREDIVVDRRKQKAKSLKGMIVAFDNYPIGKPVYLILSKLYKNRLRNAHAHNDYEILLQEGTLQYKDLMEINEFHRINRNIREFINTVYIELFNVYFSEFPVVRNIKLGYDDPRIVDGHLVPSDEDTLAELHIEGYEFSPENMFSLELIIKDNELWVLTPHSTDTFALFDEVVKCWLRQIKMVNGNFNVSFHNIVHLDPHNVKDGEIIPGFDITERIEKMCKVSESFLNEIKHKI